MQTYYENEIDKLTKTNQELCDQLDKCTTSKDISSSPNQNHDLEEKLRQYEMENQLLKEELQGLNNTKYNDSLDVSNISNDLQPTMLIDESIIKYSEQITSCLDILCTYTKCELCSTPLTFEIINDTLLNICNVIKKKFNRKEDDKNDINNITKMIQYERRIRKLSVDLQVKEGIIMDLRTRLMDTIKELVTVKERSKLGLHNEKNNSNDNSEFEKRIDKYENEISELKQKNDKLKEELSKNTLNKEIIELKKKYLDPSYIINTDIFKQKEKELNDMCNDIEKYKKLIEEKNNEIEKKENEIEENGKEIERITKLYNETLKKLHDANEIINIANSADELQRKNEEIESLKENKLLMEEKIKNFEKILEGMKNAKPNEILVDELEKVKSEKEELEKKLSNIDIISFDFTHQYDLYINLQEKYSNIIDLNKDEENNEYSNNINTLLSELKNNLETNKDSNKEQFILYSQRINSLNENVNNLINMKNGDELKILNEMDEEIKKERRLLLQIGQKYAKLS